MERQRSDPYYIIAQLASSNNVKIAAERHGWAAACICWGMEAMGMSRICTGKSGGGRSGTRVIGVVLMAVGALVLLLFVPYWVWTSVLAILLISIGFLIWRFG